MSRACSVLDGTAMLWYDSLSVLLRMIVLILRHN